MKIFILYSTYLDGCGDEECCSTSAATEFVGAYTTRAEAELAEKKANKKSCSYYQISEVALEGNLVLGGYDK